MTKKILIDAVYPDETRVAVINNNKLEEFDYFTGAKKNLKGGIYLAVVTRVEPSLQAAFIDYGGDKHGFIPFAEIHPDYYNIPVQDKQKMLEEAQRAEEISETEVLVQTDVINEEEVVASDEINEQESIDESNDQLEDNVHDDHSLERIKRRYVAQYKIQEVIKRNQILLVQAIKEERGNKGAFFTTYISLAGRYCVIMPNSHSPGGVSRKVANYEDRKRLRAIVDEIGKNNSIGAIIRTIGQSRSKEQILQDYTYLTNLWNEIREKTLSSNAPAFIHAEDDLIKRVLRDMYDDHTDEVLIQGREVYNIAKTIAEKMVESDDIKVQEYRDKIPVFTKYKVDEQIINLYNQNSYLDSGGYIVINHTEALIAIDVNSGKSTSERNIEETAFKTNMEAAKEIARQIKLRNLSGLIVIDFIDMSESRNRKAVERVLRDAFYNDKARTQVGHISSFGLLEMSRQRLKPSFLEHNAVICSHCNGKGVSRSQEANALMILRTVEGEICKSRLRKANIYAHPEPIMFILNHKRRQIHEIEQKYSVELLFVQDSSLNVDGFAIENVPLSLVPSRQDKSVDANSTYTQDSANDRPQRKKSRSRNKPSKQTQDEATPNVAVIEEVVVESLPVDTIEEVAVVDNALDGQVEQAKKNRRPRPRRKPRKKSNDSAAEPSVSE